MKLSRMLKPAIFILTLLVVGQSQATIVEFQTSAGDFQVNLTDNSTPETVANFLSYVNSGAYSHSVIHRSVTGFVTQGGGFTYDMALPLDAVPSNAAVVNEPEFSNTRGSIAMAKINGDPDSATSQWFFNLVDNSAILDDQNGGFTVFGEVVGNGMDVVDAIAALPIYNFGSPFAEIPLRNYTSDDYDNNTDVDDNHLVFVSSITVVDSTVDTSATINLSPNDGGIVTPVVTEQGGNGGGGPISVCWFLGLLMVSLRRSTVNPICN